MDRARFINFVVYVWASEHMGYASNPDMIYDSFNNFIERLIVPLVPAKVDPEADEDLRTFKQVQRNNVLLQTFL